MKIELNAPKHQPIPYWSDEKEILNALLSCRFQRKEYDYHVLELFDRMMARIDALETYMDDIVAGEIDAP